MLIGISGTLSSGKTEVARYLTFQGFKLIKFEQNKVNGNAKISHTNDSMEDEVNGNLIGEVKNKLIDNKVKPIGSQTYDDELNGDSSMISAIEIYKYFDTLDDLVNFVTMNWRENFVISHIDNMEMLVALQKRPFFLHLSIDAPAQLRFNRFLIKDHNSQLTIEEFIQKNDNLLFSSSNPLIEINNQAQVKIVNTSSSIKNLYIKLSELNLLNQSRLRPTWDSYFMRLADLAALRSNCMKRRVGCVIARENRVIATGYNGTPRHLTNCNEGGCSRCNNGEGSGAGLSTCLCLHAEENALLESGRDRIREDSVLYCNTCPCLTCSIKIVQSGIKEVVYAQSYSMDSLSHRVMCEAGIILRQFQPPTDGIFI